MKKKKLIITVTALLFVLMYNISVKAQDDIIRDSKGTTIPKTLMIKISINLKDTPLLEVISIISKKGKLRLNYNENIIPEDKKVSINLQNVYGLIALRKALENTGIDFVLSKNGQIVLIKPDNKQHKGKIKGRVINAATKEPLIGVNVVVENTNLGAATDTDGFYDIPNAPVGNYVITFRYVGFETVTKTDVIVRVKRITFIDVELRETVIEGEQIVKTAGYFVVAKEEPTSSSSFSSEEIRRAATLGGDISRIINGLPSLSNENEMNQILARGGSPIENGFYVDNIEIPNINHFPVPGSTGGVVALLNLDFIKNIDVYTGGFSSKYGDRMSSVLDIAFRNGNTDETDIQFDMNFAGISGQIEGPIGNSRGSWMFSARHSFTDIIFAIIDTEQDPIRFNDLQVKLVYDLSNKHRISLLDIFSTDKWDNSRRSAVSNYSNWYGVWKMKQNTAGVNWRYLWGDKGYSSTSLSHSFIKNDVTLNLTKNNELDSYNKSMINSYKLRNVNYLHLNPANKFEFGFEARLETGGYNNFFKESLNIMGQTTSDLYIDKSINVSKYGLFFTYMFNPVEKFAVSTGFRVDHFSFNKTTDFSPRISITYYINENTSLTGAAGIYRQNLPMYFLSQNTELKKLKNPVSQHFVLGFSHLLAKDTRLTIEMYNKNYKNTPIDPAQPLLFILDETLYNVFYINHETLIDAGEANSRGIEFLIQKKLSNKFYGLVSGTYFRAKYRALDGIWRNRTTDNRYLFSAEAGYKPNKNWEFSLRWTIAGGAPYTPFDAEASMQAQHGIYDNSKIMSKRLPDYNCLNVRFDRRFHFSGSNLIFYFSIWNLLDNENLDYSFWSENTNEPVYSHLLSRLPIFGLEFEF
ncbi:TonB-dependent receptor domain-containing protein [candidate division KSB1 bacterium]